MKKVLYFCLALFGIGFVISLVGMAMGGDLYASYYNGELHSVRDSIDQISDYTFSFPFGRYSSSQKISSEFDDLREIDFELSAGSYVLESGDDFSVIGGKIKENTQNSHSWKLEVSGKHYDNDVIITIPEDISLNEINIELGAGNLSISAPLSANKINLDVGAGKMSAASLVANDLEIDLGAGEFSSDFSDFEKAELNVGAGKAELVLTDSPLAYTYVTKSAMSKITLNGSSIEDCLAAQRIDQSVPYDKEREIEIHCGIGKVALFTES